MGRLKDVFEWPRCILGVRLSFLQGQAGAEGHVVMFWRPPPPPAATHTTLVTPVSTQSYTKAAVEDGVTHVASKDGLRGVDDGAQWQSTNVRQGSVTGAVQS